MLRFRKPERIPLLFIIAAELLLVGLGIWQVERLQWKNAIIERIAEAELEPTLGNLPQEVGGLDYRSVALTGEFLHGKALHEVGGKQGSGPGFFVLTPFKLDDDGRIILINRGWSPADKESKPEGLQTVHGIIRPLRVKRFILPDNRPDKNVWFDENISAMSQATGLALLPILVEAVGLEEKDVYPIPSNGKVGLRNDHLGYAITWFSLAAIGLIMFGFYHRAEEKS